MRKITVDNIDYEYAIGHSNVYIRNNIKKYVISFNDMFPNMDIENAMWKKYFHIKPSDIERCIKELA